MDAVPSPVVRRSIVQRVAAVSPVVWLAVAIVVYFAVSVALSWLRSLDLTTTTWDMGIYQQALWSTSHGRPFWEAADAETGGYGSFLQVHSSFLLYLLVPLYEVAPTELTLFVVQSAVVALAAVPLYLLGRDLTGSGRWGLVAGVVYLAWFPVLSANLYDFHAEAFLPLEIFAFVLLWNRSRYAWGFLVALVAFATLELAPVLLFFVGVFFLLPDRDQWRAGVARRRAAASIVRWNRYLAVELRRFFGQRRVLATLGLLAASVVAYASLLLLREQYLSSWFGFPAFPSASSGYVVGATPAALGLSWASLSSSFELKLTGWIVLFALLGFVPFLAPRALVLAVPWVVFSVFSANPNYIVFGFQYGFIEASALLVAFTYGLVPIDRWLSRRPPSPAPTGVRSAAGRPRGGWSMNGVRRSQARTLLIVGFVLLVAFNIAASPIDPLLDNTPNPALGAGYRISISRAAGFSNAEDVAALVPPDATVLATDQLFPLVANDVHAYSFLWIADPSLELPFSSANLPSYLLIAEASSAVVPSWISDALYNTSDYGVRAVAWTSPAGTVLLFQLGYSGPSEAFGGSPPAGGTFYAPALDPGYDGSLTTLPGVPNSSVVVSSPERTGVIWWGAPITLPAGNYTVALTARAWATNPSQPPAPTRPVLAVRCVAFALPAYYHESYAYSMLDGAGWSTVHFSFTLTEPVTEWEVRGLSTTSAATVALESLTITPT
jgi:uncharacterized membrane protein